MLCLTILHTSLRDPPVSRSHVGLLHACVRHALFDAYIAIANGSEVPADFNESYIVFIPKATALPGELAHQASTSRFRPINFPNGTQHIVSKALGATLEEAASLLVSPAQRGFVESRWLIDSSLDVAFVMEADVIIGASQAETVHFYIVAAFPSMEWEWLQLALERHCFPL